MGSSTKPPSRTERYLQQAALMESFPALLLVRTHWSMRAAAKYTFIFLILSIVAMVFVPWQQTSKGFGRVVSIDPQQRPQSVTASAKGVIANIREGLREGDFVLKGDVLLEIEPLARDAPQLIENQIKELETKLQIGASKRLIAQQAVDLQKLAGQGQLDAAKEAIEAAKAKVEQAKDKVQGYEATVDRSKADYDRTAQLLLDGLKSQKEFIKEKENYLKAVAMFEEGENAVIEAMKARAEKEQDYFSKTKEVEVKNRDVEQKLQEVLSEITTTSKELSETRQKLSEYGNRLVITSPIDGYVHELLTFSGSAVVKEGDVLLTIVPKTQELAVELMIRGNDVPLLNLGDEVRLQFEGYPAIQFIGWPSAARGTFGGRIAVINPVDDGQGNFRILVTPAKNQNGTMDEEDWPDIRYLRQGVLANGWVLLSKDGKLSRVPLGFEIWRQLNGFPPIASSKKPGEGSGEKSSKEKPEKVKLPK